jgi:hypothetical protein
VKIGHSNDIVSTYLLSAIDKNSKIETMNTHADKTQEKTSQSAANAGSRKQGGQASTFQFVDNRPEAVAQRKLQDMANNSPQLKQVAQMQAVANKFTSQQQPVLQLAGGKNAFLAGKEAYWHVHYDHVKFGTDDGTRVNFAGRTAKQIRKKLNEVKGRTPRSAEGSLSYHQCINYIDKHF